MTVRSVVRVLPVLLALALFPAAAAAEPPASFLFNESLVAVNPCNGLEETVTVTGTFFVYERGVAIASIARSRRVQALPATEPRSASTTTESFPSETSSPTRPAKTCSRNLWSSATLRDATSRAVCGDVRSMIR